METQATNYTLKDLLHYVVSGQPVADTFSLDMYSQYAPVRGDYVQVEDKTYRVTSVTDCTEEKEREQGLSYSKVWLSLI